MLPNQNNDLLYLLNILEHIGKIWKYTETAHSAEELFELNNQMNLNASLALLAIIRENVSKLSEDLRTEYSNIEWQQIKNFRNRIVHNYVGIDLAIVYEIITNDLKKIRAEIERIIYAKIESKIFIIQELQVAEDSNYYKYIRFEKLRKRK
ncbi:MAG: DUF86 domain-containing protein [Treponema sp.]|jgi:uncharacterized protein with HEPN domain|nr:DUF86 domain-containing protein [Treponema sp.]